MKKILLATLCLALMVVSINCGMVKGIGEDIKTVGGWVTKGSENVSEGR